MTWTHTNGDIYEITGTLVNGRRFKPIVLSNPTHVKCYNIYRGTVWVRPGGTGPRKLLWSVWN